MSIRKSQILRGRGPLCLRASGFTLVEVMVVVIVLGVVAGMLIPNLTGTGGGLRLDAVARRITSLFDYCYQSTMATGKVHGVIFNEDGRRFQVVCEEPAEDVAFDAPPTLTPVTLPGMLDPELPEGVSISSVSAFDASLVSGGDTSGESSGSDGGGGFRILFFPDGTTEFATIKLSGPGGEGRKIMLNGLSGDISIERLGREETAEAGRADDTQEETGQ